MITSTPQRLIFALLALCLATSALAQQNSLQFVSAASAKVAKAAALKSKWEGPASGPKLLRDKKIVFIAADMSDAGTFGVFSGMKEAAVGTGWQILLIDCRGRCHQGANVVGQALDMKPQGIVLAGVDSASQSKGLSAAAEAKIPVVGWHASFKAGAAPGLFTNVETDPKDAAQIAALFGIVEANNKAGIVVFTDTSNPYMATKSGAIVETLKLCEGCHVLSVEDLPLAESRKKFPALVESLVKRFGNKWTHVVAVNDVYFDMMDKPEVVTALEGTKLRGISAGDGSASAYKRIRKGSIQIASVPEPVNMHAWQLIDELNRAMSNVAPSGHHSAIHLVTQQNIAYDGGNKDTFDPSNEFREKYSAIWGK